jgi:hypothetical protein
MFETPKHIERINMQTSTKPDFCLVQNALKQVIPMYTKSKMFNCPNYGCIENKPLGLQSLPCCVSLWISCCHPDVLTTFLLIFRRLVVFDVVNSICCFIHRYSRVNVLLTIWKSGLRVNTMLYLIKRSYRTGTLHNI